MSETVFARFAMVFKGFISLFCQVLGAFWWVPFMVLAEKKYTYICENTGIERVIKVSFVCANLIVKVS